MANLKELKIRIGSVKSTQKITKAMQMVAAAKLRRAQEQAEAARPYAERMERMLEGLAASVSSSDNAPELLVGNGRDLHHLIVVLTAHRGLCGGFNSSIVRAVKHKIIALQGQGRRVKLLCIGKKGREQLTREYGSLMIKTPAALSQIGKNKLSFADGKAIAEHMLALFEEREFDVCHMVYNAFQSAISQEVTFQQLIPLEHGGNDGEENASVPEVPYDYEPGEAAILSELLPRNIGVQFYHALLENAASEQGARMTAMDNATRNAGDMIQKLTLQYNRTRQAAITKELIEIISGAEAL